MSALIVVTAPTGNIGSQVLERLLDGGEDLRVIARHPSRLPEATRARVDVVEGSHCEAAVMEIALDGADAVFWLPPGDPSEASAETAYVDFVRPALDALSGGRVRVVAVSALGKGWPREAGHVTATLKADDLIAATGTPLRALACASLMENLLRQRASICDDGLFYWPAPRDLRLPHVATRDVAAVAARLLTDRAWDGVEAIPLTGPDVLSFDDMAATMGDVLRRPVRFEPISMDLTRDMMMSQGASSGMADAMVAMLTAKNEGMDAMVPLSPASDTPTTFRTWCEDVLRPAARLVERAEPYRASS